MGKPVRRFFCMQKGVVKCDTPERGRQSAVPFTAPAPGREACPVPVGIAARRFCGAVPLLSNPPSWISWQACPSAFRRPAGRSPAAMPSGLSPRLCLSVLSDTGLLRHTGSVPGCGAAQTIPAFPALLWQLFVDGLVLFPHLPAFGKSGDPALSLGDLSPQVIVTCKRVVSAI